MSKFAAAITMPVTNANMQENSTRSITSLVICTLPDCAVPRGSPLQATSETWLNGDGCRPNFGNTRCICGQHGVGFSLQFRIDKLVLRLAFTKFASRLPACGNSG